MPYHQDYTFLGPSRRSIVDLTIFCGCADYKCAFRQPLHQSKENWFLTKRQVAYSRFDLWFLNFQVRASLISCAYRALYTSFLMLETFLRSACPRVEREISEEEDARDRELEPLLQLLTTLHIRSGSFCAGELHLEL